MSFIYENSQLLKQLLEAASQDQAKISRIAQAIPDPAKENLRSVLNNLKSQIKAQTEGQFIPSQDLSSDHFTSLNSLLAWMNGQGNAVKPKDNTPPPEGDVAYPNDNPQYYVNVEAVKNYLASLQNNAQLKNNIKFQVQLLKLIKEANQELNVQLSETPAIPQENPILDKVPQNIIPNNNLGNGDKDLTAANLKDRLAFNKWLSDNNISFQNGNNTFGKSTFDVGNVLDALNQRATDKFKNATTPDQEKSAKIYLQALQNLAKSINHQLANSGSSTSQSNNQNNPVVLNQLIKMTVFTVQNIDFDNIKLFNETYADWRNNLTISQMKDKVNQDIDNAKTMVPGSGDIFPLTNYDNFKQQASLNTYQLALTLSEIVDYTGRIMTDLIKVVKTKSPNAADYLEQQLAGPQQSNLRFLQQMQNMAKSDKN